MRFHDRSYLGTIIALTFLLPPAMSIFQSMKSSMMYVKYLVPFLFSMSFYVTGVSSYSLARFHDSSWGTRSSDQDADVEKKRKGVRTKKIERSEKNGHFSTISTWKRPVQTLPLRARRDAAAFVVRLRAR